MAAQVGSLYVSLTMNSQPFQAGITRAQQVTARAAATINRDIGLTQKSVNSLLGSAGNNSFRPGALIAVSRGFDNATDRASLFRSSLLSLTAVAGGFGAAIGANLLSRYADTFVNLSNQVRTVTDSSEELATIQTALANVSDRSRASLQATTTIYARTARATEHLGLSQEKLLRITETVQKAFSIGGATSAEASGAAIQLSQGIASDRFSGEEFRSVAENAPVLLRGMAESMGVTIGKLREMAHAGELTAAVVTKAILDSTGRIESEFGETAISIDRALGTIDNRLITYVGSADKAYGITSLMAQSILSFGDNLDRIIPTLSTVAALIGGVFLSRNKGALGGGLGALLGGGAGMALGGLEGAILGVAAGGAGGFFGGTQGGGLIKGIAADSKMAKERVVELTAAQKDLRAQTLAAAQAARAAAQQSRKDPLLAAAKSFQSAYERQAGVVQKLDQQKLESNERIVASMQRLSSVTSDITPKAAKAAADQIRGEEALQSAMNRRLMIQQALKKVNVQEMGALGMQATSVKRLDTLNKATERRRALQIELLNTESQIGKEQERMSQRQIDMTQYASEADRRAYETRMAVLREHNALVRESIRIEDERGKAVGGLRETRTAAEADGMRVLTTQVDETSRAYRANKTALSETSTQLQSATRSASLFGRTLSVVGAGYNSLIGALGGYAGIAITALVGTIGYFASEAQKAKQRTATLKEELQDLGLLAEDAGTGVDDLGKSLEEMADDELRNKLREIGSELDRIRNSQNPFTKILDYDKESLGNLLQEIEKMTEQRFSRSGQSGSLLSGDDADAAKKLKEIAIAAQNGSIDTDTLISKLDILAATNPNASGYIDDWISRLRIIAPFMDALVERQGQLNDALSSNPVDTGWVDELIAKEKALEEQMSSLESMRTALAEMRTDAGMSEEESRLKETTDAILKAWEAINEEKGISVPLSTFLAENAARELIAIEDIAAARKESAEAQKKTAEELTSLMSDLASIQSQIKAGETQVVDARAADRVQELVSDLRTGRKSAEEVKVQLQAIGNTGISNGMQGLIDRTIAAIPLVAQLLGLMQAMPGSSGDAGSGMSGPAYPRGRAGAAARRLAEARAITDSYETELTRRAALTEKAKAIEDRAQQIMDDVPLGGARINPAVAKEMAASLIAQEEAMSAAESGGSENSAYADAIKSIREKTAAQALETSTIDMNTYAIEKAKAVMELENAAREDGLELTAARVAAINAEASAYALAVAAQEEAIKKQKEAEESLSFYRDTFSSFISDLHTGLKEGETFWDSFANAASNALNKIADRALEMAANGIFDLIFKGAMTGISGGASGGGGLKLGYNLASGGQVRGPGTSRSDSIAAMLSNGEFVVNAVAARKNLGLLHAINDNQPVARLADGGHVQSSAGMRSSPLQASVGSMGGSGGVNLNFAPRIDARGADMAAVARLQRGLEGMAANFDAKVVGVMGDVKKGRFKV